MCAAISASTLTGKTFIALTELSVYVNLADRISDETILECLKHQKAIKVLVEVRGTGKFPYDFTPPGYFEDILCQVLQQTALALISNKWCNEILVAVATLDMWYILKIYDNSGPGLSDVKLGVNRCYYHSLEAPENPLTDLATVKNIDTHLLLIRFLTKYLCACY